MSFQILLSFECGVSSVSSSSSVLDIPARGGPSSWLVRWCRSFLEGTQIGLGWSCGKTQMKPLLVVRRRSGPFQILSKGSRHHTRMNGVGVTLVCQWRETGCLEIFVDVKYVKCS